MEKYKPTFDGVTIGDEYIACPKTEYEWLYPEEFIGKNIVWFFAKHINIDDFVDKDTINKFFHIGENLALLFHVIEVSMGYEMLNVLDNCRDYITDYDLQEILIKCILFRHDQKDINTSVYDLFVKMTKDPELRIFRHNIWTIHK